MRKLIVTAATMALLSGPLSGLAAAGPIPTNSCELQRFLGYENVKECEGPVQ